MAFFDKFDESNFDIDSQELDVQPVTISELKREYTELGILRLWQLGEQAARKDGTIVSRTYKTLTFNPDAKDFDFVDLGYVDEATGGQYQWRVLREFSERERYSSSDPAFKNFKIWEISDNDYQMEITYDNKVTVLSNNSNTLLNSDDDPKASFTWTRPTESKIRTVPGSCSGGRSTVFGETGNSDFKQEDFTVKELLVEKFGVDPDTLDTIDDIPDYIADIIPLPGIGFFLDLFPGADEAIFNQDITLCVKQLSLPKPFFLVYDAGKSLGAVIKNTDLNPDEVFISKTPNLEGDHKVPVGSGVQEDPYRLEYRYIIFKWDDPGRDDLTTFTVDLVGNEVFRTFLPIERDQDPECPEHGNEIPYLLQTEAGTPTRYKPPGEYDLPDNFWNDTVDTVIEDFNGRSQTVPSQINS